MNIKLFLKGLFMGLCDIIPGVSGGTIAFITGIYQELMDSISYLTKGYKKGFVKYVKGINYLFLITLFLGIGIGILIGSRGIKFLLDNYFIYTMSFFIGLILASAKVITEDIKEKKDFIYSVLGFAVGILFAFLIPIGVNPSLLYTFFGGFVGISAMFLPGISGAFILLIMGLYGYMIDSLHNLDFKIIGAFVLGALLGALTISRIISFLLKKYKTKTLFFLTGLIVGALSVPIKSLIIISPSFFEILLMILFAIIGVFTILLLSILKK